MMDFEQVEFGTTFNKTMPISGLHVPDTYVDDPILDEHGNPAIIPILESSMLGSITQAYDNIVKTQTMVKAQPGWFDDTPTTATPVPTWMIPYKAKNHNPSYADLSPWDQLKRVIPDLTAHVDCPRDCSETMGGSLHGMIQHVNDHHHMTREQVADWLESLDLDLRFQPLSIGD